MTLHTFPARRVLRRVRGGSSSPVVVDTEGGLFVAKLRGAGHGVLALIAEIIVAELAQVLGLSVPERVLIELPPNVASDDANDELADLLQRSVGANLGLRLLDGARAPRVTELQAFDDELAARVLWLDGLTMNPDRTPANPNILLWKTRPWLIDHGSALPFHHDWSRVTQDSPREPTDCTRHVFAERASLLPRFDPLLARELTREALAKSTAAVPDEFLAASGGRDVSRERAAYEAFLWQRLKFPRPFAAGH